MRALRRWLLPLLALFLMAAGAAMPYAVSTIQDSTVENLQEKRTLNEVSLTLQNGEDVQEVLQLLAGSTSDLEWQGKTNLTYAEAANAAEEALRQMSESGLMLLLMSEEQLDTEFDYIHTEPHLIMSMNESSHSAVVWLCWLEAMPYNFFYIDDKTGKMVRTFLNETGLGSSASTYSTDGWNTNWELATKRAELWRVFLSEYYGIELLLGDTEDIEIYDDGYSVRYPLVLDRGGGGDGTVIWLELHGTAAFFNY